MEDFFSFLGDSFVFPNQERDIPRLSVPGNEADSVEKDGDIGHQGNVCPKSSEIPQHTHEDG